MDRAEEQRAETDREIVRRPLPAELYERAYDAIAVKQDIVRSALARATRHANAVEHVLRFARPFLDQVEQDRAADMPRSPVEEERLARERAHALLVELIAGELRALPSRGAHVRHVIPASVLARHLAATFMLVLDWWQAIDEPLSAQRADELFRALVTPALDAALR